MWNLSKNGIAYNAASIFSKITPEEVYFASPVKVMDYIMNNLTYKVVFRHDYMPHDFTIYAYQ